MNAIITPIREKVDIIFLTHNQPEMSLKCLDALKENTNHPFRLIWIDNGSDIEHYERVRERVNEFYYIGFRYNVNRFYARAVNQGIILSDTRYVVTLSNDVFVSDNWLTKLVSIMENHPKVGLLSPLTDNIGSPAPNAREAIIQYDLPVNGGSLDEINGLPERFGNCLELVSMFCAMIRRDAIEKVGLLDERFFILANDDDYCDRIRLGGYETGVCLNCFVRHKHEATKNVVFRPGSPERIAIKRDHQALLQEKRRERAMTGTLE